MCKRCKILKPYAGWKFVRCVDMMYISLLHCPIRLIHGDVIKWKHFPRYWPFVRGIHWSLVNSPHIVNDFDVFFDLCLKKLLSKQLRHQWFGIPWHSLWCHCNVPGALRVCQWFQPTLVQAMAWCHEAPSHYLNWYWLIIIKVPRNTSQYISCVNALDINHKRYFTNHTFMIKTFLGDQYGWLTTWEGERLPVCLTSFLRLTCHGLVSHTINIRP